MLLPALIALLQVTANLDGVPSQGLVYHARNGDVRVDTPRIESTATIDGRLDEPEWRRAAVLTGFSTYRPVDQRPAPDSTDVLLWYSGDALYVGIRAFEPHGKVQATLADRDRLGGDDDVELHLDTFGDRRRAFVFIVNPLGVQADGTKTEDAGLFVPGLNIFPGQNDLSPDFTWESRGRVTDTGYEVEMRIPFASLRYSSAPVQDWGIQIVRHVQHSGYELTWTPARRGAASFIAQEGTLAGLRGMHHGQVVELNPELTTSVDGEPSAPATGPTWTYRTSPTVGGNLKWGIGSNVVLNGAVKPDFSQVEADALQIAGDARFDVFYAEKRPFFVDGSEQITVPNTLVYTRRIVHPSAAAKLIGKFAGTDVALLSALDDPQTSRSRDRNPLWTILRARHGFGEESAFGLFSASREDGGSYNRLGGADVRHVFGRLYYAQAQLEGSTTRDAGSTRNGAFWEALVDRTGRLFGFHYAVLGVHPDFVASSGFIPRTGIVRPTIANRFTLFGSPGSTIESYTARLMLNGTWLYRDFLSGKPLLEDAMSLNNEFALRGGWSAFVAPTLASYAFDPRAYTFRPSDRISTFSTQVRVTTPQFRHFAASVGATTGNEVYFAETSLARRTDANASVDWRPTPQVRVSASYATSQFRRLRDEQVALRTRVPRLKTEYQLSRAVFVRFVGQYIAFRREGLLDPITGAPIIIAGAASRPLASNDLRVDWLFSYRPTPGTVFFAGYGSSLTEANPLRFDGLDRVRDGFFVKASYLLRR